MMVRPVFVIFLLCLTLVPTTEAWRRFRWPRISLRETIRKVGDAAKKVGSFLCKSAVSMVGCTAGGAVSAGTGTAVGCTVGAVAGDKYCRKKRSVGIEVVDGMVWFPIPDDFEEYDDNKDGVIEYEELAYDFLSRWTFTKPEQLRGLFKEADEDDDGYLNEEEFFTAPWGFGSYEVKVQKTPIIEPIQDDE